MSQSFMHKGVPHSNTYSSTKLEGTPVKQIKVLCAVLSIKMIFMKKF